MLPISVGLPRILSIKKRPKRRRLQPESVRSEVVADPALPALSRSPAAVNTRFFSHQGGKEGPRTGGARPPATARRLSVPPGPRPPLPHPGNRARCGPDSARPGPRGRDRQGGWGPPRAARPRGLSPRLPPRALRAVGAAPHPHKAETPRRK